MNLLRALMMIVLIGTGTVVSATFRLPQSDSIRQELLSGASLNAANPTSVYVDKRDPNKKFITGFCKVQMEAGFRLNPCYFQCVGNHCYEVNSKLEDKETKDNGGQFQVVRNGAGTHLYIACRDGNTGKTSTEMPYMLPEQGEKFLKSADLVFHPIVLQKMVGLYQPAPTLTRMASGQGNTGRQNPDTKYIVMESVIMGQKQSSVFEVQNGVVIPQKNIMILPNADKVPQAETFFILGNSISQKGPQLIQNGKSLSLNAANNDNYIEKAECEKDPNTLGNYLKSKSLLAPENRICPSGMIEKCGRASAGAGVRGGTAPQTSGQGRDGGTRLPIAVPVRIPSR